MVSKYNISLIQAWCGSPKILESIPLEDKKRIDAMVKAIDRFRAKHFHEYQSIGVSDLMVLGAAFEEAFLAGMEYQRENP